MGLLPFRNLFLGIPSDRFRIDKAVTGVVQDAALYRYNNRTHYCFAAQEKEDQPPAALGLSYFREER